MIRCGSSKNWHFLGYKISTKSDMVCIVRPFKEIIYKNLANIVIYLTELQSRVVANTKLARSPLLVLVSFISIGD